MIPAATAYLEQDFEIEEQPTHTYRMDLRDPSVRGYVDGLEAMRQAICKILLTERYQYVMYSMDYGVELLDLYGEPLSYVCPELERRITEALLWDTRILDVRDFVFETVRPGALHVTFTVHTVFGDVQAEREVNF